VKLLDTSGALINGNFVTGLSQPDALALDTVGAFGNDLYVATRTSGTIVRVNPVTGANEVFATNLMSPNGLTFGPDGNLYVVDGRMVWCFSRSRGRFQGKSLQIVHQAYRSIWCDCGCFEVGTGDLVASALTEKTVPSPWSISSPVSTTSPS